MDQLPAPLPRRIRLTGGSVDEEWLRCDSTPQSPTKSAQRGLQDSTPRPESSRHNVRRQYSEPTKPINVREQIKRFSGDSTPPPVLPKSWPRQNSGQNDTFNDKEEIKVVEDTDLQRPPLPTRTPCQLPSNPLVDEQIKFSSTCQSPTKATQRYSGDSTPPPALPKSWSRQNSGQNDTFNNKEEKKKALANSSPPSRSLPREFSGQNRSVEEKERIKASISLVLQNMDLQGRTPRNKVGSLVSYEKMTPWSDVIKDLQLKPLSVEEIISVKAGHLYEGIQEYIQLMSGNGEQLKNLIIELQSIADNLDKVSKGTKIAGITGGASTAAGGVAAAAGVILAPFTAGASLAITVVGVGMAAAGGVTGASAAIANKANLTQDHKKIEKTLQEFKDVYEEILTCLRFVNEGMDQLKHHGVSVLKAKLDKGMLDSKEAVSAVQLVMGEASTMALERSTSASGLLEGFALGMDMFFTKDGQKVKKGLESKLAKKLRKLTEDLDLGLKELTEIKHLFCKV